MKRLALALLVLLAPVSAHAEDVFAPVTTHVLTIGGTSTRMGTGVTDFVTRVRLIGTAAAHYALGVSTVTAVTNDGRSSYLPANTPLEIRVRPGEYIAVIQDSSGGTFYITELTK